MALKISRRDMAQGNQKQQQLGTGGGISTYQVYGRDTGMMVATRHGGYHSSPHKHVAEQLNYVVDGEIWIFVEKEAFHLKTGDFLRIPSMKVHWAWIRSEAPCTMVEAFSPAHWTTRSGSVGLFADGEPAQREERSRNITEPDEFARRVEAQIFQAE